MGLYHSPSIITNNLVFYVDAGNLRSYTGSGATWFDLSLNRSNATLFNSPAFSSSTRGSIVFDGSTNYVNGSSTVTARTVISYVNVNTLNNGIIYGPAANGADNWLRIDTNGRINVLATEISNINNFNVNSTQTISLNSWNQVACTISTNTVSVYLNGTLMTTSTQAFTIGTWTSIPYLGRRETRAQFTFSGNIGLVQVYDTVLSSTEIQQNFNAFRGRYGI